MPFNKTPTAEERAQTYSAALDSVTLINNGKGPRQSEEDWLAAVQRNVDHLKIIVGKDYWVDEDLTPFNNAIAGGEAILAG